MRILPITCSQSAATRDGSTTHLKFAGQNEYVRTLNQTSPSFRGINIYKQILKDPKLKEQFADFLLTGFALLVSRAGIKNIQNPNTPETIQEESPNTQDKVNTLNTLIDEFSQKVNKEQESEVKKTERVNNDEKTLVEGDNASQTVEESFEDLQPQKETQLKQFLFPSKKGWLTMQQKNLKSVTSNLCLTETACEKLTETCKKLFEKDIISADGTVLNKDNITKELTAAIASNTKPIEETIDKYHTLLVKKEGTIVPDNNVDEDECEVDFSQMKEAETSLKELRANPLIQPEVLETIQLPEERKPSKRFSEPPVLNNAIEDTSASINECKTEVEDNDDNSMILSSKPLVTFEYKAAGTINDNLFAEPEFVGYSNKNTPLYKWDDYGDLSRLLYIFKRNIMSKKVDIYDWAKEVYISNQSKSQGQQTNTTGNADANKPKSVKIKWMADYRVAKDVTYEEVDNELSKNKYSRINDSVEKELQKGISKENSQTITNIVSAINSDSRFENFTLHAALRFIERLVDLHSPSIEKECSEKLDGLFSQIKQDIKDGSTVKAHSYVSKNSEEKYGQIIVVCNPNIYISKKDNDEYKKTFGSFSIRLALSEYQSQGVYDATCLKPIIKTLCVYNFIS